MATTQIDIDDEASRAAMAIAGVQTKDEMVNLALREYVDRPPRGSEDASVI